VKPLFEYRRVVFALAAALLPVVGARADDRVSIEAKVNGHPVHLAFDTGTGVPLVLFRDAAEKLGLKINPFPADAKPGSGNAVMMGLTEPSQLEMTGKSFANAQFYVLEVPSYFNDIQGLAGWPAFRNIIVLLKIAEHRRKCRPKQPDGQNFGCGPITISCVLNCPGTRVRQPAPC
jgi:hypothetical protein